MATKTEVAAPWIWSAALLTFGALVGVASEITVGVFAFHTADRTVLLGGLPVDALNKVAIGVLAGAIAYGGAVVTSWLATHDRKQLVKQAKIAFLVTLCASGVAVFNLATAFGWYRRSAEAPAFAQTIEYRQAVTDYQNASTRLAGEPMGYEEEDVAATARDNAKALVTRGTKPTGSELPGFIDWVRAVLAHLLCIAPAAAYRLPSPRQPVKVKVKRTVRPAKAKPKLQVVND